MKTNRIVLEPFVKAMLSKRYDSGGNPHFHATFEGVLRGSMPEPTCEVGKQVMADIQYFTSVFGEKMVDA